MSKHKVAVAIEGDVFSAFCELEGKEVDLFGSDKGFARTFNELDITGDLNVFVHCKGLNGTAVLVSVNLDSNEVLKFQGEIAKGFFRVEEEIAVAL